MIYIIILIISIIISVILIQWNVTIVLIIILTIYIIHKIKKRKHRIIQNRIILIRDLINQNEHGKFKITNLLGTELLDVISGYIKLKFYKHYQDTFSDIIRFKTNEIVDLTKVKSVDDVIITQKHITKFKDIFTKIISLRVNLYNIESDIKMYRHVNNDNVSKYYRIDNDK